MLYTCTICRQSSVGYFKTLEIPSQHGQSVEVHEQNHPDKVILQVTMVTVNQEHLMSEMFC